MLTGQKTNQGRKYYNTQAASDFAEAGVSHVRIRIADAASEELLKGLDRQIQDCLDHNIIPVIAYQADAFKNNPSEENIQQAVNWWTKVADRYKDVSYLLSFDLLIEATDSLNKKPENSTSFTSGSQRKSERPTPPEFLSYLPGCAQTPRI